MTASHHRGSGVRCLRSTVAASATSHGTAAPVLLGYVPLARRHIVTGAWKFWLARTGAQGRVLKSDQRVLTLKIAVEQHALTGFQAIEQAASNRVAAQGWPTRMLSPIICGLINNRKSSIMRQACLFEHVAAQASAPLVTKDPAMIDFAQARRMMVDGQIRPSDVTDHAVIGAMLDVPRERFVPEDLADVAYLDRDLPIDSKRSLLKPMVIARMVQALELKDGDRVLDVAGGTGYTAAILARLAGSVVALEDDTARSKRCAELIRAVGATNVSAVNGPLDMGWAALAPYDAILVNGACEVEPQTLLRQLGNGGRLTGIFGTAPATKAVLYRMDNGEIGYRPLFSAAAPLLPAFAKLPAFVFQMW